MPFVTAPNIIEQTDFLAGWCPDLEETATPPNGVLKVKNLLPEPATGAVTTRKGYKALPGFSLGGYRVRAVHPYNRTNGDQFLVLVCTNESNSGNNIQVWRYDLKATSNQAARVDTVANGATNNRQWNGTGGRHYGFTADDAFYGGGELDKGYRFFPALVDRGAWVNTTAYKRGDGVTHNSVNWTCLVPNTGKTPTSGEKYWTKVWDEDASALTYPTLVTGTPTGNQVANEKAFEKRDAVTYSGRNWSAAKDLRHEPWEAGSYYVKGDKVSHKGSWGYWRTYRCHTSHEATAGSAGNEPGVATNWKNQWKLVKLELPVNSDGEESTDWDEIPSAPKTNVAVFHGNRMFARYDNLRTDHVLFSAQADFQKETRKGIPDAVFDPADWKVTGDAGAGWIPFETQEGDNISALLSFGAYLLVFKKHSTHVISGVNAGNFTVRQVAPVGAIHKQAVCEHNGLVYFLGDQGFFYTDGSTWDAVPGSDKVATWLRRAVDWDGDPNDVSLWSFGGYVWMSLPTGRGKHPDRVLVYDPSSESFWKQDMQIQEVAVNRMGGTDQLFFSAPTETSGLVCVWNGTAHRSTSTRNGNETNLFTNPSFGGNPEGAWATWEANSQWSKTAFSSINWRIASAAARRGRFGAEVTTKKWAAIYEGIVQGFAEGGTGTHIISCFVRRAEWKKNPKKKPDIKLTVGGSIDPDTYTWREEGRGWWRVWVTYAGSTSVRGHGIKVAPGKTVQVDQFMVQSGSTITAYFDGDGTDDTAGYKKSGNNAKIYQYDHPDANNQDDGDDFGWNLQSAWFPFGVVREERRVRRSWALVRGENITTLLRTFINFRHDDEYLSEQTADEGQPVTYFEGRNVDTAYALGFEVSGYKAPAAVLGVSAQTQPRRLRYRS